MIDPRLGWSAQCRRSARVGRLGFAGCSASIWNIRCGWGCSPERRRLDGIGLGYLFLDRQPLQVPSRRRCQAGAGRLGIDTGGKPVFVGLDAAAAESGDAWAGFWPASASAAWPAAAGHLRLAAGLIAGAETAVPGALR